MSIKKLTNTEYWERWHKDIILPQRLDIQQYPFRKMDLLLKRFLPKGRNKKLLEVGTAPGRFLIYFKENFDYDVHGIEYSEIGCDLTRKNLEMADIKGEIYNANIFNNKLQSESFDVIFSSGFIEHFSDPSPVISEFDCLLKKGGYIVTIIPNMNGLVALLQRIASKEILDAHNPLKLKDMKYYHRNFKIIYASYLGSFNLGIINWGELAGIKKYIVRGMNLINIVVWTFLRRIPFKIENKYISPYIILIAKKCGCP